MKYSQRTSGAAASATSHRGSLASRNRWTWATSANHPRISSPTQMTPTGSSFATRASAASRRPHPTIANGMKRHRNCPRERQPSDQTKLRQPLKPVELPIRAGRLKQYGPHRQSQVRAPKGGDSRDQRANGLHARAFGQRPPASRGAGRAATRDTIHRNGVRRPAMDDGRLWPKGAEPSAVSTARRTARSCGG
jgi:hypothetical protein